jgi:ABC-type sulfate/molybdate transport systems ATPase subunit
VTSILERAAPSAPALTVSDLSSRPRAGRAVEAIQFDVPQRAVTVLLGSPGSGKSAVLRAIAGLDRALHGSVEVASRDVTRLAPHRRGVGLVLQDPALFRDRSVADNIVFAMKVARWRSAERTLRLADVMRVVGLAQRGDEHIDDLSAAAQLNVAIARAIAAEPRVLLLDEPLAAIAPGDRARERVALRLLLRRLQVAVVIATSDVEDALTLATNLGVLVDGRLAEHGSVREVASRPATAETARLLGYVTILDGPLGGDRINEVGVGAVAVPSRGRHAGYVEVLAHPGALLAVPPGLGLGIGVSGAVVASHPLGPLWQVEVALGERAPVPARWEWDGEPPVSGATVELATPPGGLLFYSKPSLVAGSGERPYLPPPVPRVDALVREAALAETG